jgi:CheY-like chemotaxis protein
MSSAASHVLPSAALPAAFEKPKKASPAAAPGLPNGGRLIYPDVRDCRALVIDGNATSRSILATMLRNMGVGHLAQVSRITDARKALENRTFDIVLCDYHFENSPISGQDLLDDLRRSQLLPYSTVFVMVTGEASYAKVAEAAEAALDSYLLKPHTSQSLEQRLMQARHRKTVLRTIFEAIERGEFDVAAEECQARFNRRGEYWLYAARIGAELHIRLGNHQAAKTLYEAVTATSALPWARLGVARAELESGQLPQAKRTLETLISSEPGYADAYDVMGRAQVEAGDLQGALDTFRAATNSTPHSISRLQKNGFLAFYMGQTDEALEMLERCVRIGISSKMFDCQTLVFLALVYFDKKEPKAFSRTFDNLRAVRERDPNNARLQRFVQTLEVFKALNERQVADCVSKVKRLAGSILQEDFDFEAATNVLAVLSRLRTTEIRLDDSQEWIRTIALRFCVSKTTTEMLAKSMQGHEPYESIVRDGQTEISTMAEKAMTHSVTGSPEAAVKALMVKGAETLNAKLIELAGLVLNRHAAKIEDCTNLAAMINSLKLKYCTKGAQASLGQSTGRSAGGLNLRS